MNETLEFILHSNVFNFFVVAYFLYWILFKKLDVIAFFEKKSQEIKSYIKNSEQKKVDAIKHYGDTQKALKNVDNDVKQIVSDAQVIAKTIEEKSEAKLSVELANLDNRTTLLKEAHESKAKEEVSSAIALAAVAVSKEYIENSLDENAHKELIYNFINDLEKMKVEE